MTENYFMGTGVKTDLIDLEIGRAAALDIAGYMAEFPDCTEADLAAHLGIYPAQLSEMKKGLYSPRGKQLVKMLRAGMTRTMQAIQALGQRADRVMSATTTWTRALEQHRAAGETSRVTFEALKDGIVDASEFATCEARLMDEINACNNLLHALRSMKARGHE